MVRHGTGIMLAMALKGLATPVGGASRRVRTLSTIRRTADAEAASMQALRGVRDPLLGKC